jgi:hypothetical protein
MRHAPCVVRRRHRASAAGRAPCAVRRAPCDVGIGHRLSGIGHPVHGSTFKVQSPNLQPSTLNVQRSSFLVDRSCALRRADGRHGGGFCFSPQERSDVGGRAGAAGRGARSDPPRTRGGRRPTVPPPSPTRAMNAGGMTRRHPLEVGVGATSPNVVAFGSSWRRKQEATGTSHAPCAMRFKVQRPNLQLSTFNLRPSTSSFIVHRSSFIGLAPCAVRHAPCAMRRARCKVQGSKAGAGVRIGDN